MPTAARLVAAVFLAILALVISDMIKTVMPDYTAFGYFSYVNLVLGVLCGWIVIGSRVGAGMAAAISNGLTGIVALVFWGLFTQAFNEMLRLSMMRRYEGPIDALVGVIENMVEYGAYLLHAPIIAAMIVGGIAVGIAAEWVEQRWS